MWETIACTKLLYVEKSGVWFVDLFFEARSAVALVDQSGGLSRDDEAMEES